MECHLWWSVVRLGGCSHFKQVHPGKNCAGSFCSLAQLADPQRKIWSITIIITVRLSFCHVGLRDLKHFWGWAVSASWRKLEVDAATGFSVFSVFFHFCFFLYVLKFALLDSKNVPNRETREFMDFLNIHYRQNTKTEGTCQLLCVFLSVWGPPLQMGFPKVCFSTFQQHLLF